jgi:hypothetical protein
MMIMGNTTTGGTFSSSLNVFFDAYFNPIKGGSPFQVQSEITLTSSGSPWTPNSDDHLLVHGSLGDQMANCHTNPNCLEPGSSEVDFFPGDLIMSCGDGNGCHVINPVPEPSALLLTVPALIGMFWKLRSALV